MSSDGLLLLTEPFMSRSEIDKEIEGYYVWEGYTYSMKGRIEDARRSYEKGLAHFPDSVELQSRMGRVLLELGNYAEAKNMFVQLRKNTDLEPAMAIHLLNEIATANVMIGGNDLLEEADAFSKTACEKMPWQTEFKGTRGVVLARKGHVEQGLALLKEAMDKTENPSHKAVYASYIAEFENKKRE
jgi:tetratricopeptide (TPR) repeat protein